MSACRMPAEWEKQDCILLAWPHNKEDWPDKFGPIPFAYAEIIRCLTRHGRVRLLVKSERQLDQALNVCEHSGVIMDRLDLHVIPTNRVWLRDSGPIIVRAQSSSPDDRIMLDWRFNAWAKYPNHKLDDKVPAALEPILQLPRLQPVHKGRRVVLEGGAIDVNGAGCLLTTEECLLSDIQERNPGFTAADYEAVFARYLGISQILWLGHGIVGDDTHGHVDDITRFVDTHTVVTVVENDKTDANHALLKDNLKRLKGARVDGKQLTVAELPMPRPVAFEGQRLPASYANFLIASGTVIVPTFNDPADRLALGILAQLFPTREVVGIHAVDLVWGLGTLHCMSQQVPA